MQTFSTSIDTGGSRPGNIAAGFSSGLEDGARFLQPQALGSILSNSFAIYGRNWRTISLIYITAMLPTALLHTFLLSSEWLGLAQVVSIIFSLSGMLIGAVVTVVVSDLCLGVQPRVWRSYRRAFVYIGRLVGTFLLVTLVMFGGILSLVLAIVFAFYVSANIVVAYLFVFSALIVFLVLIVNLAARYMFILPVVVLEQFGGRAAFKRSRALGKGSYLRNIGIVTLVAIPPAIVTWLLAFALASIIAPIIGSEPAHLMQGMTEILQILLLSPLLSIPGILLYYDMRARKDGYGAVQLAEELQI